MFTYRSSVLIIWIRWAAWPTSPPLFLVFSLSVSTLCCPWRAFISRVFECGHEKKKKQGIWVKFVGCERKQNIQISAYIGLLQVHIFCEFYIKNKTKQNKQTKNIKEVLRLLLIIPGEWWFDSCYFHFLVVNQSFNSKITSMLLPVSSCLRSYLEN